VLGDAELFGETHIGGVAGEEVMVEGFQGFAADLEHPGETARARISFEYANVTACLCQPQRGGESGKPSADNRHITHATGTVR